MSVALSEHLPLLATAPDGIQKLRGLILELAVRGKLVPQDPNDEPASELLKRIAKERARLEAEGKIKKSKPLPAVGDDEQPFDLPENWIWTSLASISLVNPRNVAEDSVEASFVPMAMIGSRFEGTHQQEIRKWGEVKQGFTHFAEGDIGVAKITPCFENSKACIFSGLKNGIGAGTTELHIVRPIAQTISPRFVLAYVKAPMFLAVGETKMTGTAGQKRLPKEFLETNPFPLPPLAEQHRIVAKVDELMALCDRLEAEQSDAAAAHERLVATLLGTLTQSTDAADLAANWQRLAGHFDTLFTTEASLDTLKQAILQLAVMGKLVPQDPNDEPASETFRGLERLSSAPEALIQPPDQWAVCQYRSLTSLITSGSRGWKEFYSDTGAIFIRTQNIKTDTLVLDDIAFVDLPKRAEGMRSQVLKDDILITITGANVTKAARIETDIPEAYVSQHIALTRPTWSEMARWLHLCFVSRGSARGILEKLAYGDKPGLSLTNIRDLALPIPPLAEQHRIVAKVDELLALVDRLKAGLSEARVQQERLATTLIESALAAA